MAEITRRRTGELIRELFNMLMAAPDGMQARAALQVLAGRVILTHNGIEIGKRDYMGAY